MKELNNIVVELDDPKNGKELIETLITLGARNPKGYEGSAKGNCYEVINGEIELVCKQPNKKIITLEQLKAMKEDKSEYPKLMYVGDMLSEIQIKKEIRDTRVVFAKIDNKYWAYSSNINMQNIKEACRAFSYEFAQDIEEEKPEIALEFKGQLFTGDFGDNTMTFKIDGDMILKAGKYLITEIKQDQ